MSDIIKYKESVTTKWEYRDVEVSIDELWEDWKNDDTSIVKPLIVLIREKDAEIDLLKKEVAETNKQLSVTAAARETIEKVKAYIENAVIDENISDDLLNLLNLSSTKNNP